MQTASQQDYQAAQDEFLSKVNAATHEKHEPGFTLYGPWLIERGMTYRTLAVFTGQDGRYNMKNEFK